MITAALDIPGTPGTPVADTAAHRRDETWREGGYRYPVGTVWWLYDTGDWPGGFVRSINRAVSSDPNRRVPAIGVERI